MKKKVRGPLTKSIRISDELQEVIDTHGKYKETPSDVIMRLLKQWRAYAYATKNNARTSSRTTSK